MPSGSGAPSRLRYSAISSRRSSAARSRKRQRKARLERQRDEDLVQDTAAVFTCATETADDFRYQCHCRLEDLEFDLVLSDLAYDIWAPEAERAPALVAALAALSAERRRHQKALHELRQRFDALAVAGEPHLHLDPPQKYYDLVRARLFPGDAPADPTSTGAATLLEDQIPTESGGR